MIKVYFAAPIVGVTDKAKEEINEIRRTFEILAEDGKLSFYDPKAHGVPNAWGMSISEWARCIFALDVVAIDNSDWVVVCDYGRKGTAGTAWECGYAFGRGKKVLIIEMEEEETDYSVMMRGCCANYISKKDFFDTGYNYFMNLFVERGRLEQKEVLN